jgi:predicted DNA-binding transcriptional regulator AlpA
MGQHSQHTAVMERQPYQDDAMLSRVQLAEALNISVRTVDRWIAEGAGPPYIRLPRGTLRWRWGDVKAWLEARRVEQEVQPLEPVEPVEPVEPPEPPCR